MFLIPYETWKQEILNFMDQCGWKFDRDNETTLGFYKYDYNGDKWIKDFSKETRRFVQFNGDQKINLVFTKTESQKDTKE